MQVQILNKSKFEIQFLVEGIKSSFASALRRVMMSEIPTMAVEFVDYKKNDSALNDEIIANRLGLIPLTFDKDAYNVNQECDNCKGKGCSRCQVKLVLKKKGPDMVYSEDLKSDSNDVKPAFDDIPIVELFDDQELQFEAIAQLGFGRVHTKWQGAVVGYQENPTVLKKEINPCPVHKLILVSNGYLVKKSDCEMCLGCVEEAKKKGGVETMENTFVFNVESVCGMDAEDVVLSAIDVVEKKFNEFGKDLKKLK